jgi:AraC-like DNA-binding protein
MLSTRHEPAVRGYAVTHPPGQARLPIEHGWDQLLYAESGTMTVGTAGGAWTVPPFRALWVPGGAPATATNRFPVAVRSLYFASDLRVLPGAPRAVRVSGLVHELLLHTVRSCPLDLDTPLDAALLTVLLDQMRTLPESSLRLPDPTPAAAAALIRADWTRPLPDIARELGLSLRTLERAFAASTRLSLGAWRRRARILASLDHLAHGVPVTRAAVEVGYRTPSAFVTAFKAELGQTPRRYLAR